MREISLKYVHTFSLVRDLLRNWWIIFLCAVIGASSYIIYDSLLVVPRYTSEMTLAVNLSGYTDGATVASLSRTIDVAASFQRVVNSGTMSDIVERAMGEPLTSTINAVHEEETNLVTLSATDVSPDKAYRTLTVLFENYPTLTDGSFSNIIVTVISQPSMPMTSNNMRYLVRRAFLTGVIGALLGAVIILIFSYFRDTVKNISDVENLLDIKLYGTVPHVNKRKSKIKKNNDGLLLTNPLIDYSFANSFREMAVKLISLKRSKNIHSVMLTSISENEGKTTSSVNLAIALAEAGQRVVLLDADLKLSSVYKFFRHALPSQDNEVGDYLNGKISADNLVHFDNKSGIYLAAGKNRYANSSRMVGGESFKELVRKLENEYDLVLIDTPPGGIAIDAEIISEIVSGTLFVVRQDWAPVETINDYLTNIKNEKSLGCIFNDVDSFRNSFTEYDKTDYAE